MTIKSSGTRIRKSQLHFIYNDRSLHHHTVLLTLYNSCLHLKHTQLLISLCTVLCSLHSDQLLPDSSSQYANQFNAFYLHHDTIPIAPTCSTNPPHPLTVPVLILSILQIYPALYSLWTYPGYDVNLPLFMISCWLP